MILILRGSALLIWEPWFWVEPGLVLDALLKHILGLVIQKYFCELIEIAATQSRSQRLEELHFCEFLLCFLVLHFKIFHESFEYVYFVLKELQALLVGLLCLVDLLFELWSAFGESRTLGGWLLNALNTFGSLVALVEKLDDLRSGNLPNAGSMLPYRHQFISELQQSGWFHNKSTIQITLASSRLKRLSILGIGLTVHFNFINYKMM